MSNPETIEFQAEVRQLLDIVIHSLYTDKEIFLRELVSNASDANEKLRHLQLVEKSPVADPDLPLEIRIESDEEAGTITLTDTGVGMTRDELIKNLGTIASSGSKSFLANLKAAGQANDNLIGKFGVGFYAAFMVARRVRVYTRSWHPDATSWVWTSDGGGSYTVEPSEAQRRGTRIVLELADEHKEFARKDRIDWILKRYSRFVNFPIFHADERINTMEAIWLKTKSSVKDEEYKEFYTFHFGISEAPLSWLHFTADEPLAINALLYIPAVNPEAFGFEKAAPGVALHCRKVLIDDKPKKLLPEWMRFVKGIVDSADLPLNISRETMQDSALVHKMNSLLTRRFIKHLQDEARKRPDDFLKIYRTFALYIKEGVAMDAEHREDLAGLLRYESSFTEAGTLTTLDDYISRMKPDQKDIYYHFAPSRSTIEGSAYLDALRNKGYEVLYCLEQADEIVLDNLHTYKEKRIVSAESADIEIEDASGESLSDEDSKSLSEWLKQELGERVGEVRASKRLVDNPVAAYDADKMPAGFRRMMKAMRQRNADAEGKDAPGSETVVDLEFNPRNGLIKRLHALRTENADLAKVIAEQLLDAAIAGAGLLEDPRALGKRSLSLLERLMKK